jgi:hypothetical protein
MADDGEFERRLTRLRRLGDDLDEWAAALHPSAWPETLREGRKEWRRQARSLFGETHDGQGDGRTTQEGRP